MIRFIIYVFFLFLTLTTGARAQSDAHLSLKVNSGGEAMFNFSNIAEYNSGKILNYTTTLQLISAGQNCPGKFYIYAKTVSDLFDGPSGKLNSENLFVTVTGYESTTVPKNKYGNDNSISSATLNIEHPLSTNSISEPILVLTVLKNDSEVKAVTYHCFNIFLKFSIRPTDTNPLSGITPGYYSNFACFYVEAKDF